MRIADLCMGALVSSMLLLPCTERAARADGEPLSCGTGAGMLTALACDIGEGAGLGTGGVVIGLAPADGLRPDIAVGLAVRVAMALGPRTPAWPYMESAASARALRHGSRNLVLVRARLDGERLAADVEIVGAETAGGTGNAPTLMRFVRKRPPDAEARAFLPPVRLGTAKLEPLPGSGRDALALVCADVNHDGPFALVSLDRAQVRLGALTGNHYEVEWMRPLAEFAPVAPAPLREPFASLALTPDDKLLLGLSDRSSAFSLSLSTARAETLSAVRLPWPGGGCTRIDGLAIAPRVERCTKGEAPVAEPSLRDPLDAIAGANVSSRSGRARLFRAGRRASDGSVIMTNGEREARLEHAGAQLAVGDLDGDGEPELVTSVDTLDAAEDAVVVYAFRGTTLEEKLRVPVPAGVRALAVCPVRPTAMAPIVVATSNGLGVIR